MNCCNAWGQCQQGHGCPARATALPCPTTKPLTTRDHLEYWTAIALVCGITVAVGAGLLGYFYGWHFA